MNGRVVVGSTPALVERLRDTSEWASWVPGLRSLEGSPDALRCAFGGPRPFACTLRVEPIPGGVRWDQVEGDLGGMRGHLTVDGEAIIWELDLHLPTALPEVLWTTLEREVIPEALRRMAARGAGAP